MLAPSSTTGAFPEQISLRIRLEHPKPPSVYSLTGRSTPAPSNDAVGE
jgi:hypothetical protein